MTWVQLDSDGLEWLNLAQVERLVVQPCLGTTGMAIEDPRYTVLAIGAIEPDVLFRGTREECEGYLRGLLDSQQPQEEKP